MILYQVRCGNGHGFESWFRNAAAFDALAAADEVTCPHCGDTSVTKAPMAPRIGRASGRSDPVREEPANASPTSASAPAQTDVPPTTPPAATAAFAAAVRTIAETRGLDAARMMVARAVRRHVEATHEYVGSKLAEEARRQHRGDSEERGIYGEATYEEAEALADEGITLHAIPWVPLDDA